MSRSLGQHLEVEPKLTELLLAIIIIIIIILIIIILSLTSFFANVKFDTNDSKYPENQTAKQQGLLHFLAIWPLGKWSSPRKKTRTYCV